MFSSARSFLKPWLSFRRNFRTGNDYRKRYSYNSTPVKSKRSKRYFDENTRVGTSFVDRIVLRLRNLGLGLEGEGNLKLDSSVLVNGENEKLLNRVWVRKDMILEESDGEGDNSTWDEEIVEKQRGGKRRPTLAERTIEDEELRRLRRNGMMLRETVTVPKTGITRLVLEKIHHTWSKNELVNLKFHDDLACDMKTAHMIVELLHLSMIL
ncbi:uncharacterized protein LOC132055523 [Lycium ferocissimum]|uniref:uncharacterized protein LOC132055523 n=1 Tax=Lycium ferocissimum TaxID=112874 RepID=UPI0028154F4B|nr:uncharacterized protein LOC132055523 [Lycium ferocissimum]